MDYDLRPGGAFRAHSTPAPSAGVTECPRVDNVYTRRRSRGIRAILLHAISEKTKRFYVHHGFEESPVDPMTMMITLADVEKALGISRDEA